MSQTRASYDSLESYCPFLLTDSTLFTIVPETQYVYLNYNVTFECATNFTGYTLSFNYIFGGGSITPTFKESNLTDGGIKVSTTFNVTSTNNGTRVRCIADDSVNIPMLTSLANVYVQGSYNYYVKCYIKSLQVLLELSLISKDIS